MNHDEYIKHAIDGVSIGTAIATFAGWLPNIAALFAIIWTGIRIFESHTVQKLLARRKGRK